MCSPVQSCFQFSLVWSLGSSCDTDSRHKFDSYFRDLVSGKISDHAAPSSIGKMDIPFPDTGLVYDYMFERKARGRWVQWLETVRDQTLDRYQKEAEIIVPTMDTARYTYLLNLMIHDEKSLLFVGPTGTGKSVYVKDFLMNSLSKDQFVPLVVNFSAQTTAGQTQDLIMSKLDKRRKGVFGPPMGKKCVIFVDDMNMPALEKYGAQPPIELLRQWMDHKMWYDKKDTSKLTLADIQFIGAMGPPGGSRNPVTPRFLRHFNVVTMTTFDDETMQRIFSSIMSFWLRRSGFTSEYFTVGNQVVSATMEVQ